MARYDYGWRGYRETARRRPGRTWHLRSAGEDPRDWPREAADRYGEDFDRPRGGAWWPATRVTERYNRDYVGRGGRQAYEVNYQPYAGDTPWRIGDFTRFERPYITKGGSYTYRGGREPGWERAGELEPGLYRRSRYGRDYR